MLAKTIEIAWHDNSAIWAVDISRASRVVTASGDKVARVWQFHSSPFSLLQSRSATKLDTSPLSPVGNGDAASGTPNKGKSKPQKVDTAIVEWLCDLRAHTTTINVARFSPDGLSIATAADQGEIVLWHLDDRPCEQSLLTTQDEPPKERWQRFATLRAHVQDVLDLAWSPDSARLTSASVDNTVMVWDVKTPTRTPTVLRNHSNFVQGVSMDPFGRLITSLGNDRALRIFASNASSWYQVASLSSLPSLPSDSRLFVDDSKFKNFFRRLSWSPDGSVLACPSGIHLPTDQKLMYAVHLFARNQWSTPAVQCGGLQTPACAVRFSPILYRLRRNPSPQPASQPPSSPSKEEVDRGTGPFQAFSYRMVFAVACVDSVLFYDTECLSRPFASVEGLHCAEHTDLTWSGDGKTALVSAVDGYISVICFSAAELGEPLSERETPPWLAQQLEKPSSSSRTPQNLKPTVTTVVQPRAPQSARVILKEPESASNLGAAEARETNENGEALNLQPMQSHDVGLKRPLPPDSPGPPVAKRKNTGSGHRITAAAPSVVDVSSRSGIDRPADVSHSNTEEKEKIPMVVDSTPNRDANESSKAEKDCETQLGMVADSTPNSNANETSKAEKQGGTELPMVVDSIQNRNANETSQAEEDVATPRSSAANVPCPASRNPETEAKEVVVSAAIGDCPKQEDDGTLQEGESNTRAENNLPVAESVGSPSPVERRTELQPAGGQTGSTQSHTSPAPGAANMAKVWSLGSAEETAKQPKPMEQRTELHLMANDSAPAPDLSKDAPIENGTTKQMTEPVGEAVGIPATDPSPQVPVIPGSALNIEKDPTITGATPLDSRVVTRESSQAGLDLSTGSGSDSKIPVASPGTQSTNGHKLSPVTTPSKTPKKRSKSSKIQTKFFFKPKASRVSSPQAGGNSASKGLANSLLVPSKDKDMGSEIGASKSQAQASGKYSPKEEVSALKSTESQSVVAKVIDLT